MLLPRFLLMEAGIMPARNMDQQGLKIFGNIEKVPEIAYDQEYGQSKKF